MHYTHRLCGFLYKRLYSSLICKTVLNVMIFYYQDKDFGQDPFYYFRSDSSQNAKTEIKKLLSKFIDESSFRYNMYNKCYYLSFKMKCVYQFEEDEGYKLYFDKNELNTIYKVTTASRIHYASDDDHSDIENKNEETIQNVPKVTKKVSKKTNPRKDRYSIKNKQITTSVNKKETISSTLWHSELKKKENTKLILNVSDKAELLDECHQKRGTIIVDDYEERRKNASDDDRSRRNASDDEYDRSPLFYELDESDSEKVTYLGDYHKEKVIESFNEEEIEKSQEINNLNYEYLNKIMKSKIK